MATDLVASARRVVNAPLGVLDDLGEQLAFYAKALAWTPRTLLRYKKETLRLLSEVAFGSGALAVIGGTVGVIAFMSFFTGTEVGLQGYAALNQLGLGPISGFISAFFNTREIAPLVAGLALSATVGCGFTAQLGAMRISEEIDALEVMGIPSMPYLVTTRVVAGLIAIIPLYSLAVIMSFLASRFATVVIYGQSAGVYDHYFTTFLIPTDILWSFLQAILMAAVIMLIHTFYGYTASGGPAGVGEAVGNAVRSSLIAVVSVTLLVSLAIYGGTGNFNLSG